MTKTKSKAKRIVSEDEKKFKPFIGKLDKSKVINCCFCKTPIEPFAYNWYEGQNADPAMPEGRCCKACDHTEVFPARADNWNPNWKDKLTSEQVNSVQLYYLGMHIANMQRSAEILGREWKPEEWDYNSGYLIDDLALPYKHPLQLSLYSSVNIERTILDDNQLH